MPRPPSRPLLPAVTLITLFLLAPTPSTAFPQDATLRSAEYSAATPGLFAKLWELLSAVWANGPGLDPDGASSGPGTEPDSGTTGDNGPGLEPNG